MKIIAAMPFQLNQGGQIFLPKESGFHLVNDTLNGLGEKTAHGRTDMIGVDAIPSCIAHFIKIHNDMNKSELTERYNEERWRKVVLIFVLSKYRAYEITIDEITSGNCNSLVWGIFGKKLAEETGMKDHICMLQFAGQDIALFDRKGYLLPVAQFPSDIEQELGEDCITGLEDYEKDILFTFLDGLLRNTFEYQHYIQRFIKSLKASGAKRVSNLNVMPAFQKDIFESINSPSSHPQRYFQNIPRLPVDMPEAFHSKLVLANTEIRAGEISGFGKEHTFQFKTSIGDDTLWFSGFLPLSEKMADFLERDDRVQLDGVSVDNESFVKERQILVTLLFRIEGIRISLKRCYDQKDIIYADSIPMIGAFPYVDLPKEYWNKYYLVLRKNKGTSNDIDFLEGFEKISGEYIDLMDETFSCSTEAGREEDRLSWYYSSRSQLPNFVKLCTADFWRPDSERNLKKQGSYLGCICVGKPKISRNREKRTYIWAVDMGTRNTITACREENTQNISFCLAREWVYCTLLSGMGNMDKNFTRECYAPFQEVRGSFPTMVRIYKEGLQDGGTICYEHGCALFPDMELVGRLLEKDKDWGQAAILTDIKFGQNDNLHVQALQLFLLNMLWLGSLECVLNGADEIQVMISYPRSTIKKKIENTWEYIKEKMEETSQVKISEVIYFSEAEANARYLQKIMRGDPGRAITSASIFGICDIGDGTSDFNLYLGRADNDEIPSRIQFSMRYAGNDILVNTIMDFSEKRQNDFRRIWNMPEDKKKSSNNPKVKLADSLIETYYELLKLEKRYQVEDGKEGNGDVEADGRNRMSFGNRESRRNIVLALIENVGLKRKLYMLPEESIRDFVAVLAFKYWNLFHVYGDMLDKFAPETLSFKLFFYGGGRKALESATGDSLENFARTSLGRDMISYLSSQAKIEEEGFSIYLEKNEAQKTEVVEGMLESVGKDSINSNVYNGGEEIDKYYTEKIKAGDDAEILTEKYISKSEKRLLQGYQEYINEAREKEYFELCLREDIKCIYEAVSIGKQEKRSEVEKENYKKFKSAAFNLWDEVTSDKDNPQCLWEVLFYTKMSNYLLMENVFVDASV